MINSPIDMKHIKEHLKSEEEIEGGLSSGKSVEEIAEIHDVDVEAIESQMYKGIKIETEHTPNMAMAAEIAMDHLMEDPEYYDKLEDMEAGDCESDDKKNENEEDVAYYDKLAKEKKDKVDKEVEESKVGDGVWNNVKTQEIAGLGVGALPANGIKGTVGYKSGPLSKNKVLPSDWIADPDDTDKSNREMHNLQRFKDFFKQ